MSMNTLSAASNKSSAYLTTNTHEGQHLPMIRLEHRNRVLIFVGTSKVVPKPFEWEWFDSPLANEFPKSGLHGQESVRAQQTTSDLSPLVLRQIEEIGIRRRDAKLLECLSRFEADCPDQEPVSPETMSDVNELVNWLLSQSDGNVSATVSRDGLLSVATVFPNEVRLYIEIERDGSIESAVTRERRYAIDIPGNIVADLTPEVILAAVASISSI